MTPHPNAEYLRALADGKRVVVKFPDGYSAPVVYVIDVPHAFPLLQTLMPVGIILLDLITSIIRL